MTLDISRENLDKTKDEYGGLICKACEDKLKVRCLPIMNKLNKGFPPNPREMIRLVRTLCPECSKKVLNQRGGK